jgi:hypothetical protein
MAITPRSTLVLVLIFGSDEHPEHVYTPKRFASCVTHHPEKDGRWATVGGMGGDGPSKGEATEGAGCSSGSVVPCARCCVGSATTIRRLVVRLYADLLRTSTLCVGALQERKVVFLFGFR